MGNGYLPAVPEKKNPAPPARQSTVCGEELIYISICSGGAVRAAMKAVAHEGAPTAAHHAAIIDVKQALQ